MSTSKLARDRESTINEAVRRTLRQIPEGAVGGGGAPSGPAGGVLGGTYPDPGFAVAMATDAEVATAISDHAALSDPHTVYQKESEKGAVSGYASLDAATKVPIAQVPTGTTGSTVALGNAPAAAVTAHEAAGDPHTQYTTAAEATVIAGIEADSRIGDHEAASDPHTQYAKPTGTPDGTKFLRDDEVWAVTAGGGAHASTHENAGADEIDVSGLTGVLADPQPPIIGAGSSQAVAGDDVRLTDARTPIAHAASHQSGGSDTIKLDDFGLPDDNTDLNASTTRHGLLLKLGGGTTNFLRADGLWNAPAAAAHAASHQNGGADEISVAGLSGLLADPQTPILTTHNASGDHDLRYYTQDQVDIALDNRAPLVHAMQHQAGGTDPIKLDDLAATDDNVDLNASTAKHGLMQKYPGGTSTFLRADGSFAAPPGGGALAVGTATLAFGAAPGSRDAFVDVTGLSGLSAASYIFAHAMNEASGSRGADDNRVDPPTLIAEYLTAASLRIYGSVPLGEIIGDVPVRWQTV